MLPESFQKGRPQIAESLLFFQITKLFSLPCIFPTYILTVIMQFDSNWKSQVPP